MINVSAIMPQRQPEKFQITEMSLGNSESWARAFLCPVGRAVGRPGPLDRGAAALLCDLVDPAERVRLLAVLDADQLGLEPLRHRTGRAVADGPAA